MTAQASITFARSSLSLNLPYSIRDIPISSANRHGPARSPTVLDTPTADSVKADAHCAIVTSDAPEQTISIIISQKIGVFKSPPMLMLLPSSTNRSIGQLIKLKVLHNGTSAQINVSIFQFSIPNTAKKKVEPRITHIAPQQ